MRVFGVEILEFNGKPEGIMANVDMGGDVILEATRRWDEPQWFLWEVCLAWDRWHDGPDSFKDVGIQSYALDNEQKDRFPIYHDTPLGQALHKAVLDEGIAEAFTPAIWQDEPQSATL